MTGAFRGRNVRITGYPSVAKRIRYVANNQWPSAEGSIMEKRRRERMFSARFSFARLASIIFWRLCENETTVGPSATGSCAFPFLLLSFAVVDLIFQLPVSVFGSLCLANQQSNFFSSLPWRGVC